MRLVALSFQNFRNLRADTFRPDPEFSVIHGNNGQGKTNLIEAIYLLTGQRSFRPAKEADFPAFGSGFAALAAEFEAGGRRQTAKIVFGAKKEAFLNGVPVAPSGLTGTFLAVVFAPGELSLIQDGPAFRRTFLDEAISQVLPRYLATLNALNRILLQRNALLSEQERYGGRERMEPLLLPWDRHFAKIAYSVFRARSRFVDRLREPAAFHYRKICRGRGADFSLRYEPGIAPPEGGSWSAENETDGEAFLLRVLRERQPEDFRFRCTTQGPHRDNMDALLGGRSVRAFGSQGQQRSAALALKLAQRQVMTEILGETPILLLDDVLSELDRDRRDYFLRGIGGGQVLITGCDRTIPRNVRPGQRFRMDDGKLFPPKVRAKARGK